MMDVFYHPHIAITESAKLKEVSSIAEPANFGNGAAPEMNSR